MLGTDSCSSDIFALGCLIAQTDLDRRLAELEDRQKEAAASASAAAHERATAEAALAAAQVNGCATCCGGIKNSESQWRAFHSV